MFILFLKAYRGELPSRNADACRSESVGAPGSFFCSCATFGYRGQGPKRRSAMQSAGFSLHLLSLNSPLALAKSNFEIRRSLVFSFLIRAELLIRDEMISFVLCLLPRN